MFVIVVDNNFLSLVLILTGEFDTLEVQYMQWPQKILEKTKIIYLLLSPLLLSLSTVLLILLLSSTCLQEATGRQLEAREQEVMGLNREVQELSQEVAEMAHRLESLTSKQSVLQETKPKRAGT